MRIEITGHQVEIGQSFHEYVQDKLESTIKKFFKDAISVHVVIGRDSELFSSEIVINEGVNHRSIVANASEPDVHSAFDESFRKMKMQLGKHKEQMLEQRRRKRKAAADGNVVE